MKRTIKINQLTAEQLDTLITYAEGALAFGLGHNKAHQNEIRAICNQFRAVDSPEVLSGRQMLGAAKESLRARGISLDRQTGRVLFPETVD